MDYNKTLYETVLDTSLKYPKNNSLLFKGKYINYKELIRKIDSLSGGFDELILNKGDVVTLAMPNVFEAIFAFYALNKLGVICHMVHPLTPVIQMRKFMETTKSNHLIIMDTFYDHYKDVLQSDNKKLILVSPVNEFGFVKKLGYKLINRKKLKHINYSSRVIKIKKLYSRYIPKSVKVDVKKTAFLLHSGGTSGEPKTIELSNYAINYLASQVPYVMGRNNFKDKHMLAVLPMFHGFGLCMGVHGMLMCGGVDTLMPKFSSEETVKLIKKNRCNFIIGVPSIFESLLKNKNFHCKEIRNIDQAYVGGDYVVQDLTNRFDKAMTIYHSKARLLEGYGLTEVVTVSSVNTLGNRKKGTVGKPLPGIQMGIINQRTKELLNHDTAGEIVVSGPTMMNGYLDDLEATSDTIIEINGEKWVRTGDLGFMDTGGYVHFKQRLKRIFKVSGMQVLPAEIENFLMNFSEISEVAITGKPDREKGSLITLFVVWNKGVTPIPDERIKEFIKTNISRYAVPSKIVVLEELPKTIIGKTNILELEKM